MERATYASKSFLIGLAVVKKHLTVEEASLAAHVEVNSQIERWGEVEDCALPISFLFYSVMQHCPKRYLL